MTHEDEKMRLRQVALFQDTVVWAPLNRNEMWPAVLLPRIPGSLPGVRPDRMLRCVEFFAPPPSFPKYQHRVFHIKSLHDYVSRRGDSEACKEAEKYILKFGTGKQREALRTALEANASPVKLNLTLKPEPVPLKLFLNETDNNSNRRNGGEKSLAMSTAGVLGRRKRGRNGFKSCSSSTKTIASVATSLKLQASLGNNKHGEGINSKKPKIQVDPSAFSSIDSRSRVVEETY